MILETLSSAGSLQLRKTNLMWSHPYSEPCLATAVF